MKQGINQNEQRENKSIDQDSLCIRSREECKEIWNTLSFECVSLCRPTHVLKPPLLYRYAIWSLLGGMVFNLIILKYNLIMDSQLIKFCSELSSNSWDVTKVSLGIFCYVVFIQFLLVLMQRFSLANYYFCYCFISLLLSWKMQLFIFAGIFLSFCKLCLDRCNW